MNKRRQKKVFVRTAKRATLLHLRYNQFIQSGAETAKQLRDGSANPSPLANSAFVSALPISTEDNLMKPNFIFERISTLMS